jgi:hypothetical protein
MGVSPRFLIHIAAAALTVYDVTRTIVISMVTRSSEDIHRFTICPATPVAGQMASNFARDEPY